MLDGAIAAVEINGTDQTRNNLVSWEGRYGPGSASHASLVSARTNPQRRRAFERWLWDAFRTGQSQGELFERLRELAGDGYPLAAYLFFLNDIDRFAPIAPRTFDEAFRRLGIDLRTSGRCSWANYADFNDALEAVRARLTAIRALLTLWTTPSEPFFTPMLRSFLRNMKGGVEILRDTKKEARQAKEENR